MPSSVQEPDDGRGYAAPTAGRPQRLLVACSVALLATLPFLFKPLHIDDPADLQYVRQVLRDPFDPYGFELDWGEGPRPAYENYHPPLKYYYHAAILALFGLSEASLHLSYVPLVAVTAWAVLILAERFRCPNILVLLLWLLSPGYLPGQNAMLDVPAIALGLAATALFLRGCDDQKPWGLACAAVVLGMGLLTKYSTVIYLPVWVIYLILKRRLRFIWAVVLASLPFVLWMVVSQRLYGSFHARMMIDRVPGQTQVASWQTFLSQFVPGAVFLGGCLPVAPLLLWRFGRKGQVISAGAFLIALALAWFAPPQKRLAQPDLDWINFLWWIWLATSGVGLVVLAAWQVKGAFRPSHWTDPMARDGLFLACWFGIALLGGSVAAPFMAVRRVVEAALPASMLLTRTKTLAHPRRLWIPTLLNVTLAFMVARSDYQFAQVYRDYAGQLASHSNEITAITGHERGIWCHGYWGWQYYTIQAGLPNYTIGREIPQLGSLLVIPEQVAKPARPPEELRKELRLHDSQAVFAPGFPIRLMNKQSGAGYYSADWGPLPYSWSLEPWEVFKIWIRQAE